MPRKIGATSSISITAAKARKIAKDNVPSPYNHGIDRVDRVIDTIEVMFRRRQLDHQQKRAADTYRDAFDALTASMGGSMDFDRVRAGTPSGTPPMPAALLAADTLAEAAGMLGATDAAIVEMVAGRGSSIEEAARRFAGAKEKLSDRDSEYVGRRLRDALRTLAQRWHPVSSGATIRGHIEDGAKPVGGRSGTRMVDGRAAHASETSVKFSGER